MSEHPLSDTNYYINHPNEYKKILLNRRRHEAHHLHQPVKVEEKPPPVQKDENLEVGSGPGITVTKDGAVFATGPGAVVASPM